MLRLFLIPSTKFYKILFKKTFQKVDMKMINEDTYIPASKAKKKEICKVNKGKKVTNREKTPEKKELEMKKTEIKVKKFLENFI